MRRAGGAQQVPRPVGWRAGPPSPWGSHHGRLTARAVGDAVAAATSDEPADDVAPPFPGARRSAVLIVLADGADGAEVLLTRRSMSLRNHRGEISFPGGRVDPGESVEQAAVREAFEEVALPPSSVELVGHLAPISTVVSLSHIVPVVGLLRSGAGVRPQLRPSAAEVDRVLWVSLADLVREDTYRSELWDVAPLDRQIHFFELDDETVWGATARMLVDLLRVAHRADG